MAKKKKQKKGHAALNSLTLAQVMAMGDQHMANGAPREAIDLFRFAINKHGLTPDLKNLMFRAYLLRSVQLRKKGMMTEADAMVHQALPYRNDPASMSEDDLIFYVSAVAGEEAFNVYNRFVGSRGRVIAAEERLAGHLFQYRQWACAGRLDDAIPLKQEAPMIRDAVSRMDAGDWEGALELLRPLSRKSPFSPIRLLCRAMTAFYQENDAEALKALSMIPDAFPLSRATRCLTEVLSFEEGTPEWRQAASRLPGLWDGPVKPAVDVQDLIDLIKQGEVRAISQKIKQLAADIHPEESGAMSGLILRILWGAVTTRRMDLQVYDKVIRLLLGDKKSARMISRIRIVTPETETPLTFAGAYLTEHLAVDFPDPEERTIAHAAVLLSVVRDIRRRTHLDDGVSKTHQQVLGIASRNYYTVMIEMAVKALRLDPDNRQGYVLLAGLPRHSRESRKLAETAMTGMLDRFPDDPFPCLELASIYYETRAFRKAETILKEAMRRAPHDDRVIDRHAVSLLISAESNLRRDKFHLVDRDLERAGTLNSRKIGPYLAAKRMATAIMRHSHSHASEKPAGGQLALFQMFQPDQFFDSSRLWTDLNDEISRLFASDAIRMLAFLYLDLENRQLAKRQSILDHLKKELARFLKKADDPVFPLLVPLGKEYTAVFPSLNPAPVVLSCSKNLLSRIPNQEIGAVYDVIMDPKAFPFIEKDIRGRLKTAGEKESILFRFYLTVVRHLAGDTRHYALFDEILSEVDDPSLIDELRGIARRLSRHARSPLRESLELFRFDEGSVFLSDDDDDDEDVFPFGEFSADDLSWIEQIIKHSELDGKMLEEFLESAIDRLNLRGAPNFAVNAFRRMLKDMAPPLAEMLNRIARRLESGGPETADLSREAHVLLYGDDRRKKSRKRR